MRSEKRTVIKIWLVCLALGIASILVQEFLHNDEALLLTRLAGSAFFLGLYVWIRGKIKTQNKMIKESNGFLQQPYDPNILRYTLLLIIIGWSTFSIMDYLHLNLIDWIMPYTLCVVITPISLKLLPLWMRDNKFRDKK